MTNFLQFDPIKNNMLSDMVYQASSFRQQGAMTGIASASAHNKLFYQLSTMVAALAQMMENKGYNIEDTSIATLVTELSNIMTRADMAAYAPRTLLDSYVAKAPVLIKTTTSSIATHEFYRTIEGNSATDITFTLPTIGSVANGAWVKIKNIGKGVITLAPNVDDKFVALSEWDEITVYSDGTDKYKGKVISTLDASAGEQYLSKNGYQKFESGLLLQWGVYESTISGEQSIQIPFVYAFPKAENCFNVIAIGRNVTGAAVNVDLYPQVQSFTASHVTFFLNRETAHAPQIVHGFYWQAIGSWLE